MKRHPLMWLLPLLFVVGISPFTPWIDLELSRLCYYSIGESGVFYNPPFFRFLYTYGEYFGLASGVFFCAIFTLSFFTSRLKKWRKGCLALCLTLLLGAGLLTNALFKEYWGRPRPKQLEEFGGSLTYRPFWQPNFASEREAQKSFPSGHVAMGYYFLSLCLVGKRYKSRPIFYLGLFLTVVLGGGLMLARISQGGHFFSDVIYSPLLMWLVALFIDARVFTWEERAAPTHLLK